MSLFSRVFNEDETQDKKQYIRNQARVLHQRMRSAKFGPEKDAAWKALSGLSRNALNIVQRPEKA